MIFDLPLRRFVKMRNLEENEAIDQDFNEQNSADRLNLNDPTFWSAFARNFREQVDEDDEKQTSSRIFCDAQHCDASFEEIVDYEDHYEQKHKHQCLICQKSFTSAHGLEIHFDENHSILFKVNLTRETGFPRYRCLSDKCEKRFLTFTERNEHSAMEHGIETGEMMDVKRKMRRRVEHEAMRDFEVLSLNPNRTYPSSLDFRFTDE